MTQIQTLFTLFHNNNNNMHRALDVVIIIMISIPKTEVQHVVSNGF